MAFPVTQRGAQASGRRRARTSDPQIPRNLLLTARSIPTANSWWNRGACFYVGGRLWEDAGTSILQYTPGRIVTGARNPHYQNGTNAWYIFVNNKASLCNVGGEDWNRRSRWYNTDVFDVGNRGFNTFGQVIFRNVFVHCRTANGLALTPPNQANEERNWARKNFRVFRAYDTGQSHVLDSWRIHSSCGTEASPAGGHSFRSAQIWSLPHGVNVTQNQLVMRNITYVDGPPDPVKLFSFDVGNARIRIVPFL